MFGPTVGAAPVFHLKRQPTLERRPAAPRHGAPASPAFASPTQTGPLPRPPHPTSAEGPGRASSRSAAAVAPGGIGALSDSSRDGCGGPPESSCAGLRDTVGHRRHKSGHVSSTTKFQRDERSKAIVVVVEFWGQGSSPSQLQGQHTVNRCAKSGPCRSWSTLWPCVDPFFSPGGACSVGRPLSTEDARGRWRGSFEHIRPKTAAPGSELDTDPLLSLNSGVACRSGRARLATPRTTPKANSRAESQSSERAVGKSFERPPHSPRPVKSKPLIDPPSRYPRICKHLDAREGPRIIGDFGRKLRFRRRLRGPRMRPEAWKCAPVGHVSETMDPGARAKHKRTERPTEGHPNS